MAENFQQKLFDELRRFLEPLATAFQSSEGRQEILRKIGWRPETIDQFPVVEFGAGLDALVTAFNVDLLPLIANPPTTLEDLPKALTQAGLTVSALVQISDAVINMPNRPIGLEVIGEDLLGLAAVQYLDSRHKALTPLLVLLTLIDRRRYAAVFSTDGETLQREPVLVNHFAVERIKNLLTDPVGTLKTAYHLDSGLMNADLTADTLFPRIANLAQALGLPVFVGFDRTDGVELGTFGDDRAQHMLMVFVPVGFDLISDSVGFGVGLALNEILGLVVHPFGNFDVRQVLGRWAFELKVNASPPPFAISRSGIQFVSGTSATTVSFDLSAALLPASGSADPTALAVFQIGSTKGTRLEVSGFRFDFNGDFTPKSREFGVLAEISKGTVVLSGGDGDGFLGAILPKSSNIDFKLGIGWSTQRGLFFAGSAGLEVTLPVSLSIADVLAVSAIHLTILISGEIDLIAAATVSAKLGPVTVTAERIGISGVIGFPQHGGNLGPIDGSASFQPPSGIGIAIDAGPVSGGGFISFKDDRYSGVLQLQIYSVTVQAFGVIETKLPGGAPGFSFAIVISAEFNPIQLGLGFTLNGVGGIIGINRSIDADALRSAVRTGSLENLLFPHDLIHDAPQIIHDLQAVLPATDGRYVFGPMAKIGWGTPTIIDAELGIILELPGWRLALLGEVHALLPRTDKAIVKLNLSVAGLLDFPKKVFEIDASLHDSQVGSYPITGDMAMRLLWGDNPSFALAVGGFHPAYQPPPGFPTLRRVAVDLGVSGNPSLTLQGYFAITSNSVQTGALAELKASSDGIDLYGRVQFDAILIFSPFSFEVSLSASVRVSFHGHGIGVHLSGVLSGPSPWRVRGEVCVSILFWDACLSFDKSFGSAQRVAIPAVDPWSGAFASGDPTPEVPGLQKALTDVRNWTPELPPAAFSVVSLVSQSTDLAPPLDPLGVAVVRQRVCPLNLEVTRFGSATVTVPVTFNVKSSTINGNDTGTISYSKEPFAKAQFVNMTDAQKLSAPSFETFDAAIRVPANDNSILSGSQKQKDIKYTTKILGQDNSSVHSLPLEHLIGMSRRSAAGLTGLRRAGAEGYLDPTALARFGVTAELFVIADRATFKTTGILANAATKFEASLVLTNHLADHPEDEGTLQVVPKFELGAR